MIGNKGNKGNSQGIVWVPYIIQSMTPVVIDSSHATKMSATKMSLKSRYSIVWMKNWKRKSKIENIYKIEKPVNN